MSASKFSPSKFPYPRAMAADPSTALSPTIGAPDVKIPVGILGATGTVGQRFIALLASHPWFKIHALGASPRSAGKPYRSAVAWKQTTPIPSAVRDLIVHPCDPAISDFQHCKVIFSGLDAEAAGDIGTSLPPTSEHPVLSVAQRPPFGPQNPPSSPTQKTTVAIRSCHS
jgi:aspartate-semialdehyde dehydrogenase